MATLPLHTSQLKKFVITRGASSLASICAALCLLYVFAAPAPAAGQASTAVKYEHLLPLSGTRAMATPGLPSRYIGPGSCSATACHGGVQPQKTTDVLQNEYSTWVVQDKHSRSFTVLSNPVSKRIARILGLPTPNTAPRCLACHSLNVPSEEKGREFAVSEGVSCESCHGPASGWLGPHVEHSWPHEKSVALGMYDTKNLISRTEKCLTCHLGTPEKKVDHELIAAGHPDLVFELDSFQAVEPKHWIEKTSDPLFGVRAWSVGQAVQLKEGLNRLARNAKGPVWPEYAELDCFTCHHSLTDPSKSWRQEIGYHNRRPGNPPWNASRYVVFRHLVQGVSPDNARRLDDSLAKVEMLVAQLSPNKEELAKAAEEGADVAGQISHQLNSMSMQREQTLRLMKDISADADNISRQGERVAEQAAMALDSLYIASHGGAEGGARSAINGLFQQLENPSAYNPHQFAAQMRKVNAVIR